MAHFTVAIIVKDDHSSTEELSARAIALINKFDSELEVPLYKRYVVGNELENMQKHYKVEKLDELVPQLENWNGESGGTDEQGLFVNSTRNPEGHFDDGNLEGCVLPEDFGTAFLGEGNNRICHAVVTPDGLWIEGPWSLGSSGDSEVDRAMDEWVRRLRTILEENKQEAVFFADCHY